MSVQTVPFSNVVSTLTRSEHGHPSNYQTTDKLKCELDVEKRLQAFVAKDGVRVKEFFIDFDKLRKGYCGEAAVSFNFPYKSILC